MDSGAVLLITALLMAVAALWWLERARGSDSGGSSGPWWPLGTGFRRRADERAEALLREILSEREYRQLLERGYIEVRSRTLPGRVYRVPRSRAMVRVYEYGMLVDNLCVESTIRIPDADRVLMHKLLIEGDETEYLKIANHFTGRLQLR